MEKMSFAILIVLWVVWLASEGKLLEFIKIAGKGDGREPRKSLASKYFEGSIFK